MTYEEFEERYQYDPQRDFLARGGFGAVYKAYDTVRKRHVAIKEADVNPTHKFSLLREVELSREIEPHDNIVWYENPYRFTLGRKITDYAVMPYFKHGNLNTVLANEQLTDADCRAITEGILKGIGHLHRQGFIHRDLKASNILMEYRDGHWIPKIADFGLSKLAGADDGVSNSAVGLSVAYASPEQLRSEPLLPNVDLWAVGVAVYKIVTGALPFDAPSGMTAEYYTAEVASKIRLGLPPEKSERLPQPYRNLIERSLVVDNRHRVATAEELLAILQAAPVPEAGQTTITTPGGAHRIAIPESSQPSRPSADSARSQANASGSSTPRPVYPERGSGSGGSMPPVDNGGYDSSDDEAATAIQPSPGIPVQPQHQRRKPALVLVCAGAVVLLAIAGGLWLMGGSGSSTAADPVAAVADTAAIHQMAQQVIAGESKDFTRYTALMDSLVQKTPNPSQAADYRAEALRTLLVNANLLFEVDQQQEGCIMVENALRLVPGDSTALSLRTGRCNP